MHSLQEVIVFLDSWGIELGSVRFSLLGLTKGLIVLFVALWGAKLLISLMEKVLKRATSLHHNTQELIRKISKILIYFFVLMIVLGALGVDLTAFAVFTGALGVGIGFGLQKITSNFLSGIILLLEKSLRVGDLISVGGEKGHIKYLGMRHTLLEIGDGREVMVPNEDLILTRVTSWSYSSTRVRDEIVLTVEFGSNSDQVREMLLNAARGHREVIKEPAPACLLTQFAPSGLQFLLQFWVSDVHKGSGAVKSDIMFEIIRRFRENKIRFSAPQQEIVIKNLDEIAGFKES